MDCSEASGALPDIDNCDWTEITSWLKTEFLSRTGLTSQFSELLIQKLLRIIQRTTGQFMWYNCLEAPVAETLTQTLKVLRAYVVNERVAAYIVKETSFYENLNQLMVCLFTKMNGPKLYTKYLLQFFVNLLSVGNEEQKRQTRHQIREHTFIRNFHILFYNEYGHLYEVSAVLYNLYCDIELNDNELISYILQYHADTKKTNIYLDFLVEKLILGNFVWQNYDKLLPVCRLDLLRCLHDTCNDLGCDYESVAIFKVDRLPEACLICFVNTINRCANVVFQVTQQGNTTAAVEVSLVLELLAQISSDERYLPYLQNNTDTLINAGVLLINVHRLGKAPNTPFSPVSKLSQIQNPSNEIEMNPVFGFKADLVRLIGNLCWKSRRMQDLARECELIPVLLDLCNIDAKNPFIMQWVILAIRNICENNQENQAIIAGLTQQGVVSSEALQEFGLTLHAQEDLSVGLIRLDLNK